MGDPVISSSLGGCVVSVAKDLAKDRGNVKNGLDKAGCVALRVNRLVNNRKDAMIIKN